MNATSEKVFIEALSLPLHERAALVHRLLVSLERVKDSPEVEAAWKQEALDRCKAGDEGELTEREATAVLRDAYDKLQ